MVETLLVPDDLDRYRLARAVVTAVKDLAERALAKRVDDLVAESQVVTVDDLVIPALVVVAVVVRRVIGCCHLFLAACTDEVH